MIRNFLAITLLLYNCSCTTHQQQTTLFKIDQYSITSSVECTPAINNDRSEGLMYDIKVRNHSSKIFIYKESLNFRILDKANIPQILKDKISPTRVSNQDTTNNDALFTFEDNDVYKAIFLIKGIDTKVTAHSIMYYDGSICAIEFFDFQYYNDIIQIFEDIDVEKSSKQ